MAFSSTSASPFYCSTKRPLIFPSPKFSHGLASFIKRAPSGGDLAGIAKKATGRLLDAFVDLAFKFQDQPWRPSQSNFKPVEEIGEEVILTSCIEGVIPYDFPEGVYIRNGPNPRLGALQSASWVFGVCSETWMEGEGMVNAISFSKSSSSSDAPRWTVSYKNRFVESETFRLDRHPSFLPIIEGNSLSLIAAFLLNQLRFGKPSKALCNTNVFEHSGRVFAVAENDMPHEIDLFTLNTIAPWDINGMWDRPFIAHPKRAPGGELVFVGSHGNKPFLLLGIVSAHGMVLQHKVDLKLKRAIICHDIGVTNSYNIILDMPLTLDINRVIKGGPLIKYEKESYARIGVMPRYGDADSIKWFEVEPYCTLHIVNCYEDGDEVIVRGGRSRGSLVPGPDLGLNKFQWFSDGFKHKWTDENSNVGQFITRIHEWRLNLKTGNVKEEYLTGRDFSLELPIINDRYVGLFNQYAFAHIADLEACSICAMPKHGALAKLHLDENDNTTSKLEDNGGHSIKMERHQLGANEFCSGAAFVAMQGGVREDDGWIISNVHNEEKNTSHIYIIDAQKFEDDPVAKISLPSRVPYGFHGAFIPRLNKP